jgi:hypothetical protein
MDADALDAFDAALLRRHLCFELVLVLCSNGSVWGGGGQGWGTYLQERLVATRLEVGASVVCNNDVSEDSKAYRRVDSPSGSLCLPQNETSQKLQSPTILSETELHLSVAAM